MLTLNCFYTFFFLFSTASRIRYEITSGNIGGAFAVKNMTGAIYVAGALDYETRKRVSIYEKRPKLVLHMETHCFASHLHNRERTKKNNVKIAPGSEVKRFSHLVECGRRKGWNATVWQGNSPDMALFLFDILLLQFMWITVCFRALALLWRVQVGTSECMCARVSICLCARLFGFSFRSAAFAVLLCARTKVHRFTLSHLYYHHRQVPQTYVRTYVRTHAMAALQPYIITHSREGSRGERRKIAHKEKRHDAAQNQMDRFIIFTCLPVRKRCWTPLERADIARERCEWKKMGVKWKNYNHAKNSSFLMKKKPDKAGFLVCRINI